MTPRIQVAGVCKQFPTVRGDVAVLRGVDLVVHAGEFLGIVGPSGCGKSTLLACLAGFESITGGTITVDGAPLDGPSPRRVLVFQESALFPWLTVSENVAFGLAGRPSGVRDDVVRRCVRLVGLEGFETARPFQLSGGMKQRVELARALAVDPDVLLLDEPFGALDALTRLAMRAEMERLWSATGTTCILVTHDVEEAITMCDRIAVMTVRPATICATFANPLARPRDPDHAAARELKYRILEMLGVRRPADDAARSAETSVVPGGQRRAGWRVVAAGRAR
jgi:ABC-type nitrate/sulfonate/bicarbonate transport system ATPase subunit